MLAILLNRESRVRWGKDVSPLLESATTSDRSWMDPDAVKFDDGNKLSQCNSARAGAKRDSSAMTATGVSFEGSPELC